MIKYDQWIGMDRYCLANPRPSAPMSRAIRAEDCQLASQVFAFVGEKKTGTLEDPMEFLVKTMEIPINIHFCQ
jgi:hypothetical protein